MSGAGWSRAIGLSLVSLGILLPGARTAQAAMLRVPEEYPTIQAAVDAAQDGDEISIAPGTYKEDVKAEGSVSGSITITGRGWPTETVIKGSFLVHPAGPKMTIRSLTVKAASAPLYTDGVNIVATDTDMFDVVIQGHANGLRSQVGSHVILRRTLVKDNVVGIQLDSASGHTEVLNSVVVSNSTTGINVSTNGLSAQDLTVRHSIVAWNGQPAGTGGGVIVSGVQPPSTPNKFTMTNTILQTNRPVHRKVGSGVKFTESKNQYKDPTTPQ